MDNEAACYHEQDNSSTTSREDRVVNFASAAIKRLPAHRPPHSRRAPTRTPKLPRTSPAHPRLPATTPHPMTTPCFFFTTPSGCPRGSECQFQHTPTPASPQPRAFNFAPQSSPPVGRKIKPLRRRTDVRTAAPVRSESGGYPPGCGVFSVATAGEAKWEPVGVEGCGGLGLGESQEEEEDEEDEEGLVELEEPMLRKEGEGWRVVFKPAQGKS